MSKPGEFFNKKEAITGTGKTTDNIITRKEYEKQLEEAKAMAFKI